MATEFEKLSESFLSDLDQIQIRNEKIIDRANKSIILARDILHQFKNKILSKKFKNSDEEIHFFKNIKQIPLVPLIYFTEIRSFEIQFPKACEQVQREYIKRKMAKLDRFYQNNMDFVQYIENKRTHFDIQYFTRSFLDTYHIMSSKFYFQDPDFSTARDMLLGKLKAYNKLLPYLQNRLNSTRRMVDPMLFSGNASSLKWTASKTAMTELIYALHSNQVINNGNIDIKDIALTFQNVFHFNLGDFYKIFSEIKSRKINRTKFLDNLSAGLQSQMEKSEE